MSDDPRIRLTESERFRMNCIAMATEVCMGQPETVTPLAQAIHDFIRPKRKGKADRQARIDAALASPNVIAWPGSNPCAS